MKNKLVSIVIINYNGKAFLKNLFESIFKQNYKNIEIIFVDNNSKDESIKFIENEIFTKYDLKRITKIIKLNKNFGFAPANNIAVKQAKGEYILFLNNDTTLTVNSISEMVKTLEKDFSYAGVTPKTYLSRYKPLQVFDSIGTCMDKNGSPYNRGIGQIDLGQYDKEEEVFGICFAVALVKKDIYVNSCGLDNSYFAYFEDVDWCFRIRKMGYLFLTCPTSLVYHHHSGTSSKKSYSWKYYLIFRNYLRTVVKTFGKKNLCRVILIKIKDLIKASLNQKNNYELRKAMIKVVFNFFLKDMYIYLIKRINTRRNFIDNITDEYIFNFSKNEPSNFFDPVNYKLIINFDSIEFAVIKSYLINSNKKKKILEDWDKLKRFILYSKTDDKKNKIILFFNKYFSNYLNKASLNYIANHLNKYNLP